MNLNQPYSSRSSTHSLSLSSQQTQDNFINKIRSILKVSTNDPHQLSQHLQQLLSIQNTSQQLKQIANQFQHIKTNHNNISNLTNILINRLKSINKYPPLKNNIKHTHNINDRNKLIEQKLTKMSKQLKSIKEQLHNMHNIHNINNINHQTLIDNLPQSYILSTDGQWIPDNSQQQLFGNVALIDDQEQQSNLPLKSNFEAKIKKNYQISKEQQTTQLGNNTIEKMEVLEGISIIKDQQSKNNNHHNNQKTNNNQKSNNNQNNNHPNQQISFKDYAKKIQNHVNIITKAKTIQQIYQHIKPQSNQQSIIPKIQPNKDKIIQGNNQNQSNLKNYNNKAISNKLSISNNQSIKIMPISAKQLLQNVKNVQSQQVIMNQPQEIKIKNRLEEVLNNLKKINPNILSNNSYAQHQNPSLGTTKSVNLFPSYTQVAPTNFSLFSNPYAYQNALNSNTSFANVLNKNLNNNSTMVSTDIFKHNNTIHNSYIPNVKLNENVPFTNNIQKTYQYHNNHQFRDIRQNSRDRNYNSHSKSIIKTQKFISNNNSPKNNLTREFSKPSFYNHNNSNVNYYSPQLQYPQIVSSGLVGYTSFPRIISQCLRCKRLDESRSKKSLSKSSKGIHLTQSLKNSRGQLH